MKKFILFLFLSFPTTLLFSQHDHESHSGKSINLSTLLEGFDLEGAIQLMNSQGVPNSDRPGYLRYLKVEYLKKQYPEMNFADFVNNPYKDYKPKSNGSAKSIYCTNANFDSFNFTNWAGGLSTYGNAFSNTTVQSNGLNAGVFDASARHTITTTPPLNNNPSNGAIVGYDELALNPGTGLAEIPLVAPNGGVASCRLGNANTGAEIERMYYDMAVTINNPSFYYSFAIVLQDPSHSVSEQPYFKITVKDQNGVQIGGLCGVYNVNATLASSDASFIQLTYQGEPLYYRKWELVSVDLSAYIGTTVRIEFESADCSQSGHFGYAYVDAGCGLLGVSASLCSSDDSALIIAPPGFDTYEWAGPNDDNLIISGETDDSLFIPNPIINDTFYLSMESASGCISDIQTVLEYTTVTVGQLNYTNSCPGGSSGSATIIAQGSTQGYNYLWTPGNFTTATVNNLAAGTYNVHVESIDPACGTLDTFVTIGSTPIIPLQITSNFCDATNTTLVAPAGSNYQWYSPGGALIPSPNGTNDSLNVTNVFDGMNYFVTYTSTQGCNDSTIVQLNQSFLSGFFNVTTGSCGAATINYIGSSNPTFSYEITGPSYSNNINNTSQTTINLTGLLPGSYTATINDAGCTSSSAFDIIYTINNTPTNVTVCPNGTQTLTSTVSGTHNWTDPTGTQSTTGGSGVYTFPMSPPLAGTYVDSTTLTSGCVEVSTFIVTVSSIITNPVVNLNPCPLEDLPITSTSSGTHFWMDPNSNLLGSTASATFTINDIVEGIYTDSTNTSTGCIVISTYNITYNSIVTTTSNSNIICYGDSDATATVNIISGPSGTNTQNWSGPSGFFGTGSSQISLNPGTYYITTTNGNCITADTIVISSPGVPSDTLQITGTFCSFDPIAILYAPTGFSNYQWYYNNIALPGEDNDSIIISDVPAYLGYSVTYSTPPNGCERTTTFIARTNTGPLFLPTAYNNVFTPNNDSKNEKFFPFYTIDFTVSEIQYYTEEYRLSIYNRWGELMFSTETYTDGWDGKVNGKECAEGVYYWTLYFDPQCDDEGSEIREMNGVVHLLK